MKTIKKITVLLIASTILLSMTSCSKSNELELEEEVKAKVRQIIWNEMRASVQNVEDLGIKYNSEKRYAEFLKYFDWDFSRTYQCVPKDYRTFAIVGVNENMIYSLFDNHTTLWIQESFLKKNGIDICDIEIDKTSTFYVIFK